MAVIVEASHSRPHFAGPSYVRVGSETITATSKQFEEMIASRNSKARPFLEAKRKGEGITVFYWTYGMNNRLAGAATFSDCTVIKCTPHYVVFKPPKDNPILADYDRIILKWNHTTNQLQVDIDG